jgi:hypothetical protein
MGLRSPTSQPDKRFLNTIRRKFRRQDSCCSQTMTLHLPHRDKTCRNIPEFYSKGCQITPSSLYLIPYLVSAALLIESINVWKLGSMDDLHYSIPEIVKLKKDVGGTLCAISIVPLVGRSEKSVRWNIWQTRYASQPEHAGNNWTISATWSHYCWIIQSWIE